MAEFSREAAVIEAVYIRRPLPNGQDEYMRRPYNLITYDDGQLYVEPLSTIAGPFTYGDVNSPATASIFRIADSEPFAGVTEVR
jgi:hypothetical protein